MKKRFLALLGAVLLSLSLIGTSTFSVIADENTESDDPENTDGSENEPDPDAGNSGEDDPDNSDEDDPETDDPDREDPDKDDPDGNDPDDDSAEDDPNKEDGAPADTDDEETEKEKNSDEEASDEESADKEKEPEDGETDDEELTTASARLERALSAYENVLDSEYDLDKYLQDRVEKGSFSYVNLNSCGYRTSDEVFLDFYEMPEWAKDEEDWLGPLASWAALCNYYDDYINHDAEYYDFGEYITTHTAEELAFTLFDRSVYEDLLNDSFDAWNVPMVSVVRLLPYLSSFDEVTLARVEVTPEEKKAAAERNRAKEDEREADVDEDGNETDANGDENENDTDTDAKADDTTDDSDADDKKKTDKSDAGDENKADESDKAADKSDTKEEKPDDDAKSDGEADGKVLGKRREASDTEQSDADDTEDYGDELIYELHIFLDGADSGIIPVLDEDGNLLRFDVRYADLPEELPCSFADDDEIFDRWWLKITECE